MNTLIIETTRRCQFQCDHCLRGCSQNKDMPIQYVETFLQQMPGQYIGSITFTGGEPSLAVDVINDTLKLCNDYGVEVGYFYIATNGYKIGEDFVIACLRWYSYCVEKEMCQVHVSNDGYHASEGNYSTELLDGLSFFSRKFSLECDYYHTVIINEGLAAENGIGARDFTPSGWEFENGDFYCEELYLNCKGELIAGCDLSYESQSDYKICNVSEFAEFIAEHE